MSSLLTEMEEPMHSFARGLLYAAATLFIAIPATAQVNTMEIPKSPAKQIRITRFTDEPVPARDPFPGPELESLRKAAITIHNDDDRQVVALCVIWTVTSPVGHTSTITVTMDEYLSTIPSVGIAPHGKLTVAPTGLVAEIEQGIIVGSNHNDVRLATRLADAQSLTVSVDSIIFADGTVWGPDSEGFDQSLTARKAAAAHIAQVARRAMAYNEDPANALKPFATGAASNDHQADWESQFANQLLANPERRESLLQYLESLPSPPRMKKQPQQ
jgi:hypothetical protein